MLPDRFWSQVDKTPTCWLWTGATARKGYGSFYMGGRQHGAHRLAFQDAVGPIPSDLQLDHLCRVHNCVNPAHLEIVDCRTNVLRGEGPTARNARKTHCVRGHPLSGPSLMVKPKGRECRICRNISRRARRVTLNHLREQERLANLTYCKRGHPYDERNTRWRMGPGGVRHRNCRACNRARVAEARSSGRWVAA